MAMGRAATAGRVWESVQAMMGKGNPWLALPAC
jgi:hypothetical protein